MRLRGDSSGFHKLVNGKQKILLFERQPVKINFELTCMGSTVDQFFLHSFAIK
jgi:hypothetical protein